MKARTVAVSVNSANHPRQDVGRNGPGGEIPFASQHDDRACDLVALDRDTSVHAR